ncbi:MAG: Anti-sigma-factor antagonist and glycosyl transferase [Pedosphaera sp.]|nr:Anti-sigma-factor antagonist and glycosyl transferase [Pedosphaera sp.]
MNSPAETKTHLLYAANPPIAILGVPFDNVTTSEAVALVEQMVASRRPHYMVTANVDFLVQAQEDVELRRILFDAHLVLCDGTPLVWASRLLGNPLPERVAGADLVPLLVRIAAARNYRLFFLGGTPESTSQAIARIKAEHPNLSTDGYSPPFNKLLEMDHEEIKRRIAEAKPDFLFVSFGCPKQEKWINMHYQSLGVPVSAGVGATIDFLAGQVKRAPTWMHRTGAEWLFRLAQEPRRLLRRYIKDLWVFGWTILAQWWQLQFRRNRSTATRAVSTPVQAADTWQWIKLPERLDMTAVRDDVLLLDQVLADGRHCLLEMANVQFIDSTGIGLLIRLQKKIRVTERQLILLAPSPVVLRALALMHLQDFFASAGDLAAAQQLIAARAVEQNVSLRTSSTQAAASLAWQGEIIAANAEEVWRLTEAQLASATVAASGRMVIDLSQVRFMDSTGLGIMVRARKLAQRQGIKLAFTGVQPAVQNVLRLARLEAFLLGEQA